METQKPYFKILAIAKTSVWYEKNNPQWLKGAILMLAEPPTRKKGGWYRYTRGMVVKESPFGNPCISHVSIGDVFGKLLTEEEFKAEMEVTNG